MVNHQAIRSVVAADEESLVPVADQFCVGQRWMQKSSNVAKDVNAMAVLWVDTKCASRFVMESLR
jgi:hypothetical protein